MALIINGHGELNDVQFNGLPLNKLYFNGILVWPDEEVNGVWYKYNKLEHITDFGMNEIAYELHLSAKRFDGYKYSSILDMPTWLTPQEDVVGPNGSQYTTPLSFVRRVVFDNRFAPVRMLKWFQHLYGGLNNVEEATKAYPFEWVNFRNLSIKSLNSLSSSFFQCHVPELDLSNWNTKHIVDMECAFKLSDFRHIYVGDWWSVENVTNSKEMFKGCIYLHNYQSVWTDKSKAYVGPDGYLERKEDR